MDFKLETYHQLKSALELLQNEINSNIDKFSISLDIDPVTSGLTNIHNKLAQCSYNNDMVSKLLSQSIKLKSMIEVYYKKAGQLLETKKSNIINNAKENFENIKSQSLRDSEIARLLNKEINFLCDIEELYILIKDIVHSVQTKLESIKDCTNNLKAQIKIIQIQVQLGEISG